MTRSLLSRSALLEGCAMLVLLSACSQSTPATPTEAPEPTAAPTTVGTSQAAASVSDCSLLNLNTVTEDQLLKTLPNFSSRMVREFFEYRPYASIQQFRKEIGKYVDDSQVATWEGYVYVPVDPNNADAQTLQQLPGVDETVAAQLIANRPYADQSAFQNARAAAVSPEQAAQAVCYLTGT